MKLSDALKVFNTRSAVADAIGVRAQTLSYWGEDVPAKHTASLFIEAKGNVKVTSDDVRYWQAERDRYDRALSMLGKAAKR